MGKLGSGIVAEFLKIKRTWILGIHIIMPVVGILIFLWYYSFSEWETWGEISGYTQVLTVVCPTLVGVICALAADQEKQAGHMQNLLGLTKYKTWNLGRKMIVLLVANFLAVFAAVAGFGVGFQLWIDSVDVPIYFYFVLTILIWIPQIFSYCFHLFLGLRFSKGVTIGAGIIESLLAALLLTGLGEGIWQFIPCACASRFTGYYITIFRNTERINVIMTDGKTGVISMTVITALGIILLLFWMSRYEGHAVED